MGGSKDGGHGRNVKRSFPLSKERPKRSSVLRQTQLASIKHSVVLDWHTMSTTATFMFLRVLMYLRAKTNMGFRNKRSTFNGARL